MQRPKSRSLGRIAGSNRAAVMGKRVNAECMLSETTFAHLSSYEPRHGERVELLVSDQLAILIPEANNNIRRTEEEGLHVCAAEQ